MIVIALSLSYGKERIIILSGKRLRTSGSLSETAKATPDWGNCALKNRKSFGIWIFLDLVLCRSQSINVFFWNVNLHRLLSLRVSSETSTRSVESDGHQSYLWPHPSLKRRVWQSRRRFSHPTLLAESGVKVYQCFYARTWTGGTTRMSLVKVHLECTWREDAKIISCVGVVSYE